MNDSFITPSSYDCVLPIMMKTSATASTLLFPKCRRWRNTTRRVSGLFLLLLLSGASSFLVSAFSPTVSYGRESTSSRTRHHHVHYSKRKAITYFSELEQEPYFIRKSLMADLGYASKILADGFHSDKNIILYQLERLQTYLSLESTFPKIEEQHEMFSLCRSNDGRVIAFCEIDNRPTNNTKAAPRPYMCNLAVDLKSRGFGFAKDLVRIAEQQAVEWEETEVYLKVRQQNGVAVGLYSSLGYKVLSQEYDSKHGWTLLLMKKELADQALHAESYGNERFAND